MSHKSQPKRKKKEAMRWTKTSNGECSVHLILKIGPTKVISYIYLNHGCCLKRSEHEHEGKTHDKDIPHPNIERHLALWTNNISPYPCRVTNALHTNPQYGTEQLDTRIFSIKNLI